MKFNWTGLLMAGIGGYMIGKIVGMHYFPLGMILAFSWGFGLSIFWPKEWDIFSNHDKNKDDTNDIDWE